MSLKVQLKQCLSLVSLVTSQPPWPWATPQRYFGYFLVRPPVQMHHNPLNTHQVEMHCTGFCTKQRWYRLFVLILSQNIKKQGVSINNFTVNNKVVRAWVPFNICWWEGNREPLLFKILNWAVAAHLSKTGNFMFPLLLIATTCLTLLLHMFTHIWPNSQ